MMRKILLFILIAIFPSLMMQGMTKVDVLIIGGGASGTTAAISAAREGASVAIIEEGPWVGGMLTSAGVSAIDGNYRMRAGLFGVFCDSLAAHYGGYDHLRTGWVSNILFEPSVGQSVLRKMIGNYPNIHLFLNTKAVAFKKLKNGWRVTVSKAGKRSNYEAKVLIDATELGDVAAACGVKYDIGMDSRSVTGENIAPEKANGIIQDLTYVAILKDYGFGVDKTISMPAGYDKTLYENCLKGVKDKETMLSYGKLPNGKYMINWPTHGNDYYADLIELSPSERAAKLEEAKTVTLGFVYYIQTELGLHNLGLADDEFPSADRLALIPYHRESRRIHGMVRFTMDYASKPFDQELKLYRTGIAVGDYPVDHHHGRYKDYGNLPDLHFYPIPSFNLPLGCLIPKDVPNLIVAEKSISVSNLINGATRLQPVVMQIGEAAGILAGLSVREGKDVSSIGVREVQKIILDNNGYLMPYLDLPISDTHFKSLQRIGATGIMKGIGKPSGWSNETWFNIGDEVLATELVSGLKDYYPHADLTGMESGTLTVGQAADIIRRINPSAVISSSRWAGLGLDEYNPARKIKRGELAVLLDQILDPFDSFRIGMDGSLVR
jgi:hypothetical protein